MNKEITFSINSDIYEKFLVAVNLTKEETDEAVESCMRRYISETFKKISLDYDTEEPAVSSKCAYCNDNNSKPITENTNYGKANKKIPLWAYKPFQYNHKIIKSFFYASAILGTPGAATLLVMEKVCSDPTREDLYVKNFKSNYAQMKTDAANSHGKVFEDDGQNVWIWDEVKETLMQYENLFK